MGITCLTVGLSVFVLSLHHRGAEHRSSNLLRKLALTLAKVTSPSHHTAIFEDESFFPHQCYHAFFERGTPGGHENG